MKQNWTYKKLGEVATITMGQSPSSDTYNKSVGLPFFQGNADFGKVHPNVRIYCNAPIRIADSGDVLISVRAPIGAINIADRKCCIGRGLAAIRGNKKNQSRFIYYLLLASKDKLVAQGTGSTFKSIGKDTLYNLLIPFVSLSTQSRIVSELDLLQSLIDKQKAQLKELDTLAQSIFYDMFGDPVENEKGWEVKKLGEVCKFVNGDRGKNYPSVKDFIEEGFPFINAGHLLNGKVDFTEMNYISEEKYNLLNAGKIQNGDILFCLRGSLGKYAKIDFDTKGAIASSLVIIRCKECINLDFVIADLNTPAIKSQIQKANNGSSQPNLSAKSVAGFSILFPPISLQQEFASKIEMIERQKSAISQSIAETQKLFDYTMDKYFG